MIPNKDIYADKDNKITDDPSKFAIQVAVAGVHLEDRIAKRYGITDELVSVDEPGAVRKVIGKAEPEPEKETEQTPKAEEPEAEATESKASVKVEKAAAKKPAAKKGAKK